MCVCRGAFAPLAFKKGVFSAFEGLGRVLDMVCVFPWLLGGFFGGEGERVCPPLFFSNRVDGGVTTLFREQKIFMKVKGDAPQGRYGVYILARLWAEWLRQNRQCKSCGDIANLATG